MADFEVKIATEQREIEQAQRLRFQVFNLELNKGLRTSYAHGLDIDEFDPFCDHLLVRDLKSGDVVGTYRLMRGSQARQHIGFYSEKEFDLSQIKLLDGELMELGRSCARKDFRDRALIPLMWDAIAEQVKKHQVRYLFGCGSLYTTAVGEVSVPCRPMHVQRFNRRCVDLRRTSPVPKIAESDQGLFAHWRAGLRPACARRRIRYRRFFLIAGFRYAKGRLSQTPRPYGCDGE